MPILAASVFWGTTGTAGSLAPAGAPAAAIGSAGLALGGLLLFLSHRGARLRCTRAERGLLLLGAVAIAGYPITFYPAVARTGVAVATVITLGSAPVFAGLLAWIIGRARPSRRWLCATAAAVLGCAVLVLGPELSGGSAPVDLAGVVLAAVGGFCYAVYSLISARLIARGHASNSVMGTMFGIGGLLVLPVVLGTDMSWLLTLRGAAVALHLAVFPTFVAYRLFGYALRHTTAQVVVTLTFAEPAVAAILGVVVLGERLPMVSWGGLAVLALALVMLAVPTRSRRDRLRTGAESGSPVS
ncbi:DMT family transporter [Nocardia sp. NBC_01009]|uniref:DMT family transporter n=1 Tax=Nocardia sp. NBC_01009 TaxID=2975996 RepID=UPI0038659234|nr:EamA family transporter [Nocardia sp. NBC_01009]